MVTAHAGITFVFYIWWHYGSYVPIDNWHKPTAENPRQVEPESA